MKQSAAATKVFLGDELIKSSQEELLKHVFKNAVSNYEKSTPAIVTREIACN